MPWKQPAAWVPRFVAKRSHESAHAFAWHVGSQEPMCHRAAAVCVLHIPMIVFRQTVLRAAAAQQRTGWNSRSCFSEE